jgi:protein O-GlcNAc transferase
MSRGDWEAAEIAFNEALDENPHEPEANLGLAQMALQAGYPEDVHGFTRMLQQPDERAAKLEYAALRKLGRKDEGLQDALAFLTEHAGSSEFRFRVGCDLLSDDQYAAALVLFRKGRELQSEDSNMAGGEAAAYFGLGRIEDCRKAVEKRVRLLPKDQKVFAHWVSLHAGKTSVNSASFFSMSREWDRRFGNPRSSGSVPFTSKPANRKLRVGFVSSTFRHHANCQFLLPLLEALDREAFLIHAYHDGAHEDDVTLRCREAVDRFRRIHGMPAHHVANTIRSDEIDVLFDINAHFDDGRLEIFAQNAAPVQVHYLGGVGTTGMRSMHWRLADDLTEPPNFADADIGTEQIFRIEGGIHAFRPLRDTAEPDDLPNIRNGFLTFGCLNALSKIEDPVLELWARCLQAVPHSRLRLIKQSFRHEANRDDFSRRAKKLGIDPSRLELKSAEISSFDDLSVYHGIDVALDTFAYNGITTTCEALWMGVPVVSLQGNRFVSREAGAILQRIAHPEWVARTPEKYVQIVQSLAENPLKLATIRELLREEFKRSPVADAQRLASEFRRFLLQFTEYTNS